MGLNPLSTTYAASISKTLCRYLDSPEGGYIGPALRHHTDPHQLLRADDMGANIMRACGWIEGVRAETHTYGGFALHVTIDTENDTTETRRKVRAVIRTFENAVRNIAPTRYAVHGMASDGEPSAKSSSAPFYIYDSETDIHLSMIQSVTDARLTADLMNLELTEITLEA